MGERDPVPHSRRGRTGSRHAPWAAALAGLAAGCASYADVWIEPPVDGLMTAEAPATAPASQPATTRVENIQAMLFVVADRLVRAIPCELGVDASGRLFHVAIQSDHFDELLAGRARIAGSCSLGGERWRIVIEKPPPGGRAGSAPSGGRRMNWTTSGRALRVDGGWERM